MTTSSRLRGKEGFYLSIKAGSAAAFIAGGDDTKAWEITQEDRDDADLTFWEAAQGQITDPLLKLTSIISFDDTSLWSYLFANPGAEVIVTLGPKGNAVAAAGKPLFRFTGNLGGKPPLQNEARTTNEGAEFEYEIKGSSDLEMIKAA